MKEIKKIVMKHPIASLFISIALVVPCSIALFITHWLNIYSQGPLMIILTSVVFSIISICLWGVVYLLTLPIAKKIKAGIDNNPNWEVAIITASFGYILWSFIALFFCWFKSYGFNWFIFLTYIIPVYRIIMCLAQLFYMQFFKSKT